jgi:hypothetical protein
MVSFAEKFLQAFIPLFVAIAVSMIRRGLSGLRG